MGLNSGVGRMGAGTTNLYKGDPDTSLEQGEVPAQESGQPVG